MQYDFTNLKVINIDGSDGAEMDKAFANAIYAQTRDLGLLERARDIHAGKPVDLSETEVIELKRVADSQTNGEYFFTAIGRKCLHDFLDKK
ncbi:hypothetical protein KBA63_00110 [Candidatus Woesebacteria bacterium]|nr:hypothetical protein [Candidatus Woesebacteria bacterium]